MEVEGKKLSMPLAQLVWVPLYLARTSWFLFFYVVRSYGLSSSVAQLITWSLRAPKIASVGVTRSHKHMNTLVKVSHKPGPHSVWGGDYERLWMLRGWFMWGHSPCNLF